MNPELLDPAAARTAARTLFLLLHRDHADWFDLVWEASKTNPPSVGTTSSVLQLPGLGAAATVDPAQQRMARDFAVMATTFLIESPTARGELLHRLKEACAKRGFAAPIQAWLSQAAEEILGQPSIPTTAGQRPPSSYADPAEGCLVWQLPSHCVRCGEPEQCDGTSFVSRFWDRRRDYDLFVNGRLVFAPKGRGDQELKLVEEEYRALIFLLLHRSQPIKPLSLYCWVYQHQTLAPGLVEADIMTSHVKPLISRLRAAFESPIPALCIPDKRLMRGYAISGLFDACLMLLTSDAESFLGILRSAR